jgi:hypothetical protein
MSTMHDGGPSAFPGAARPRPTLGWRIRHSWWLLFPILGFGCLNGIGFIYVGLRTRRPAWWVAGIVYLLAGWAFFILVGTSDPESNASDWFVGGFMAVWIGSLVHACLINSAWLQWRSGYVPWHAQPPMSGPAGAGYVPPPGPHGMPRLPAGLAPPPQQYYGPGPAATAMPAPGTTAPPNPPASIPAADPSTPGGPLDVNTATSEQLAALPGFDQDRVARVRSERQARRGFGSVEEFAAAANLAPHEFVQTRDLLVCVPPATPDWSGSPSPGRILDV